MPNDGHRPMKVFLFQRNLHETTKTFRIIKKMYKTYMIIIFKVHRVQQQIANSSTKLCMNKYLLNQSIIVSIAEV